MAAVVVPVPRPVIDAGTRLPAVITATWFVRHARQKWMWRLRSHLHTTTLQLPDHLPLL